MTWHNKSAVHTPGHLHAMHMLPADSASVRREISKLHMYRRPCCRVCVMHKACRLLCLHITKSYSAKSCVSHCRVFSLVRCSAALAAVFVMCLGAFRWQLGKRFGNGMAASFGLMCCCQFHLRESFIPASILVLKAAASSTSSHKYALTNGISSSTKKQSCFHGIFSQQGDSVLTLGFHEVCVYCLFLKTQR